MGPWGEFLLRKYRELYIFNLNYLITLSLAVEMQKDRARLFSRRQANLEHVLDRPGPSVVPQPPINAGLIAFDQGIDNYPRVDAVLPTLTTGYQPLPFSTPHGASREPSPDPTSSSARATIELQRTSIDDLFAGLVTPPSPPHHPHILNTTNTDELDGQSYNSISWGLPSSGSLGHLDAFMAATSGILPQSLLVQSTNTTAASTFTPPAPLLSTTPPTLLPTPLVTVPSPVPALAPSPASSATKEASVLGPITPATQVDAAAEKKAAAAAKRAATMAAKKEAAQKKAKAAAERKEKAAAAKNAKLEAALSISNATSTTEIPRPKPQPAWGKTGTDSSPTDTEDTQMGTNTTDTHEETPGAQSEDNIGMVTTTTRLPRSIKRRAAPDEGWIDTRKPKKARK